MSKLSLSKWSAISSTTTQAPFLIKNTLPALKCLPAFSVHSVSKQIVLSIFSQGVNIQSSRVWSLNAIMMPAGSLWKPSAKALWQAVWSIWMPAVPPVWPYKTFKSPSMLITGHYPAGFLMLVHLLEINSPLVALCQVVPTKNTQIVSLLIFTRCLAWDNTADMYTEFRSSMSTRGRYTSLTLNTAKIHGLDTKASRKQHEALSKCLKAKKFILHIFLLGEGGCIYNSHS